MYRSKIWSISDEEFTKVVEECICIRDIVEVLGFKKSSGSMGNKVKERIEILGLDTKHLVGRNAKGCSNPIYSLDEILIENSKYTTINRLKIRLVKENRLEYKCSKCGNVGDWNGEKLVLQLDHINGIHNDHRIENLRFLCPNCHSQTNNFAGKNTFRVNKEKIKCMQCTIFNEITKEKKRIDINTLEFWINLGWIKLNKRKKETRFCLSCGIQLSKHNNNTFCLKCSGLKRRKVERPTLEQLLKDVDELGYLGTGRKYDVSDVAVRKWIKKHKETI